MKDLSVKNPVFKNPHFWKNEKWNMRMLKIVVRKWDKIAEKEEHVSFFPFHRGEKSSQNIDYGSTEAREKPAVPYSYYYI